MPTHSLWAPGHHPLYRVSELVAVRSELVNRVFFLTRRFGKFYARPLRVDHYSVSYRWPHTTHRALWPAHDRALGFPSPGHLYIERKPSALGR